MVLFFEERSSDPVGCESCAGYDNSKSSDNLVSAKDYITLPVDVVCSFGSALGTCAAEIDGVAYQCVGTSARRRELAQAMKFESRRNLQACKKPSFFFSRKSQPGFARLSLKCKKNVGATLNSRNFCYRGHENLKIFMGAANDVLYTFLKYEIPYHETLSYRIICL